MRPRSLPMSRVRTLSRALALLLALVGGGCDRDDAPSAPSDAPTPTAAERTADASSPSPPLPPREELAEGRIPRQNQSDGSQSAVDPGPEFVSEQSPSRADALTLRDFAQDPEVDPAELGAPCPRLISAAPNLTEICAALGLAPRLVGRTRYCTHPSAVLNVPSIGALNDLNLERVVELRPELILVSGNSRMISERLERARLKFISTPDTRLDDLFAAITLVGQRCGRPLTAARLAASIREQLDQVAERHEAARHAAAPGVRVLVLTAPLTDPPNQVDCAGPGSFYDDLLRLAGHANAAASSGRAFAQVSLEYVLQQDPEVIIELAPDASARPGGDTDALRVWAKVGPLRAVRAGRVHVLVGPEHFLLGPRVARTFEALCRAIAGAP